MNTPMKALSRLVLVGLVATTFSGCIYINGEKVDTSDWKESQEINREAIGRLDLGLSTQAVKDQLGTPNETEAFMLDGEEVRVLFYRTSRQQADGKTTRDETTPLVFKNDQLIGWGNTVYDTLR